MNLSKFLGDPAELPLERLAMDGGFTSIFRTIGCIGDSLSSGEFESTDETGTKNGYHDYFEYSWGQFIARAAGCQVYNFSRGGMTAKEYWETFAEAQDFWNPDKLCQAYIIALGANDLYGMKMEVGSVEDIDFTDYNQNKPTFCGYYAKIIQRLKTMQPHAKFFLVSLPRNCIPGNETNVEKHSALINALTGVFDYTYAIDLAKYAPDYDDEFKRNFYLGGHKNPMGYQLTGIMIMSYIDYIIRHHMEDFAQVGFIGKGIHNYKAKW